MHSTHAHPNFLGKLWGVLWGGGGGPGFFGCGGARIFSAGPCLDLIICTPDLVNMGPEFHVGDCVGSDHLPIHFAVKFGQQSTSQNNPIFT